MRDDYKSEDVCAPGVNFLGGSCITIDLLEDMINVYNFKHQDKIDISYLAKLKKLNPITYKKRIVEIVKERMSQYKCDTQTCWLTLPFFKQLSDPQKTRKLHKHTFKPIGPRNTVEWLNTFNINEVFAQYEIIYPDFKFMGAQPRDFDKVKSTGIRDLDYDKLIRSGIFRLGFIFNLDEHDESGSHWVALFADLLRGQIYFIDSVGEEPAKEFRVLMNRIKDFCETNKRKFFCQNNRNITICNNLGNNSDTVDMRHNTKQHQHGSTECGVYSISFILRLLDGETFDEIVGNKISDEEIKLCRASYFRINK